MAAAPLGVRRIGSLAQPITGILPSACAAVYSSLQQRHVVPVLFVHGHLGSHQQMRSAASETGRELARRLAANASWPIWLQWYAADFNAEPSALDANLLVGSSKSWHTTLMVLPYAAEALP
jgi:hypothetical protein